MELAVLWHNRTVHCLVAVAFIRTATPEGRRCAYGHNDKDYNARLRCYAQDLLPEGAGGDRHTLHVALQNAGGTALKGVITVPYR